jgi:peptidyl-prolyl cis-trans isomerase SurA
MNCARKRPGPSLSTAIYLLPVLVLVAGAIPSAHAQEPSWAPTVHGKRPPPLPPPAVEHPKPAPAPTRTASREDVKPDASQSIVALVNDEPITGYEIDQRVTLASMGAPELQKRLHARLKSPKINDQFKAFAIKRLKANPPKSQEQQQERVRQLQAEFVQSVRADVMRDFRPVARKNALDELIDEHLKMQEAKKLDVIASKDEVDRILKGMAERNKMTLDEFAEHVKKMGADMSVMRQRIKASLSWADVIRRKFGHQIVVASRDVDRLLADSEGQDNVGLKVQRIFLPIASEADQKRMAERMSEAERMRGSFRGCASMPTLASAVAGARYDDLGERKPSSIPEPTRSLLLNARDGEMLPPTIGETGVELWAVCGRESLETKEDKRQTAQADLRQKEFEILSKKHLKDLRQDAHIEIR